MKTWRIVFSLIFIIAAAMMLAACGGGDKVVKPDTGIASLEDSPNWVTMGANAFPQDRDRAFYGVGSAPKMMDSSMQKDRAKLRATDDLAGQLETYVSSLKKDYAASTSDGNAEIIEDHFNVVRKQVTSQTLSGVQFAEMWLDRTNGELYVLVRLDFVAFKSSIEKAEQLNSRVKEYIRGNAERMHDELMEEEDKR